MLSSIKKRFSSPLIPLCLVILIDHIGFGIIYPVLVPLFMDSGSILGNEVTDTVKSMWYSVTLAIFPLCLFFGATLLGSLSDVYGRKRILIICLLGAVISYSLFGFAIDIQNIYLLMLSRALSGLTAGSMPIAQAAVMDISSEKEKASNLGIIILSASLGFLLGPLVGGFFANKNIMPWFSYSTPLYFAALLALLNLYSLRFFKETFVPKEGVVFKFSKCLDYILAPFTMKNIRFLSLVFLIMQLGWSFYFQFISVFLLKRYQFSAQDISLFMCLMGIGFALGSCWVLKILSKYMQDLTVTLTTLGIVVLSVLFTVIELHAFFNWIGAFFIGMCMASAYSMMIKLISETVSEEHQGFIMGVSEAIVAVAWAITPIAAAFLENLSLSVPLIAAVILLSLCTLMLSQWRGLSAKMLVD